MPPEGPAPEVEEIDQDPNETLRLVIIGLGILANVVIVYWQVKDTAEMIEMRARLRRWWEKHWTYPERRRRELARMEAETVFEAMNVVEQGNTP